MLLTLTSTLLFLVSGECKQNSLCRLKTYSVPCNPSTSCSHVEVLISVNEIENGESDFNVTLVAYNMDPSKSHGIMLTFAGQKKTLKFSCLKLDLGSTQSSVYNNKNRLMTGSSIYMNGNLICTWIAQPFTYKQSPYAIELLDLVYNANYSLELQLDENVSIIAQDASELPWYQLGFTKCGGYQIYGDNEYQLIIKKKMNFVQFWINTFDKTPKFLRVSLSHESLFLNILCNYTFPIAAGYSLSFDGTIGSFTDDRPNFNKIVGNLCSVDLPDTFECKKGLCSIWDLTFDLDLSDDEKLIYSLHNLKLNESLSGSRSSCNDIAFLSSFIIASALMIFGLIFYIYSNLAKNGFPMIHNVTCGS
ncbi:uncharacterized protein LOC112539408 [Tetranychus urticae]|uniref:uncharacterized protein LOC112539408 n=1 Tax=Tetranychus urticae TaxID=32264 RepID=UPI000D64E681|nr:uncharacterized protein LOC112539408 [Tetranychus urticae]